MAKIGIRISLTIGQLRGKRKMTRPIEPNWNNATADIVGDLKRLSDLCKREAGIRPSDDVRVVSREQWDWAVANGLLTDRGIMTEKGRGELQARNISIPDRIVLL